MIGALGTLRFTGNLPAWLVIGGALAAAAAVAFYYGRETRGLASPYDFAIPAMRGTAVALAVLLLAVPVWHSRSVVGTPGRIVFMVDTSASMVSSDAATPGDRPDRLRRIERRLLDPGGWVERFRSTHRIEINAIGAGPPRRVYSDSTGAAVPRRLPWPSAASISDLAAGLSPADAGGSLPTAIVILSDGRHNAGGSPIEAAAKRAAIGHVVHAIGFASADEPNDLGINNVLRDDAVAGEGRLTGKIQIKSVGVRRNPVAVSLQTGAGGKTVWQRRFAAGESLPAEVEFDVKVADLLRIEPEDSVRGVTRSAVTLDLTAAIDSDADDAFAINNRFDFRVAASMRKRRLLILDGSSRWEMRYLRNLFSRDPAWNVDTILFGPGTDRLRLSVGDMPGEFPADGEAMSKYDAVILGEVPASGLEPPVIDRIVSFVARGGGLILLDGRYEALQSLAATELSDLFPVRFRGKQRLQCKHLLPTAAGQDHPAFQFAGPIDPDADLWRRLPGPNQVSRVRASEGAEVWADAVLTTGDKVPWLVTRLYGSGRVFYFASDETWRWRYKVADRFHSRFWNAVMASVVAAPYAARDQYVAIGTDRLEYDSGAAPIVRARLQAADGDPLGDLTVDAVLSKDDLAVAVVPLTVDDADRGTYVGQSPPLSPGRYDIRIRASGFDEAALQASTPVWVGDPAGIEFDRVALDEPMLRQITAAGGGTYRHESSADDLLAELEPLSRGRIIESDYPVWQSFGWFGAIMGLLTIEWLMRKRAGLI